MDDSSKSKRRAASNGQPSCRNGAKSGLAHRHRSNFGEFGGIHNRRDKRFPFGAPRIDRTEADAAEAGVATVLPASEPDPRWVESVTLWLSWNAALEYMSARMYESGQCFDSHGTGIVARLD